MTRTHRLSALLCAAIVATGLLATAPAGAEEPWPWPNVRVSNDKWLAHSEVSIAQDPTNPDILVGASKMFQTLVGGASGYRFKIGTYRSEDGGATWQDQGLLGGDDNATNYWTTRAYQNTTDPVVAFDSNGNAYAQILVYRGTGQDLGGQGLAGENAVVVYKSADKGKTWGTPIDVYHMPPGPSFAFSGDKNWLTVDTSGGTSEGFLYSTWTFGEVAAQHIYFAASYDGGTTWTAPRMISTTTATLNQISQPVVGPDGTIYVIFEDYTAGIYYLTKSSDYGATWTQPSVVTNFQAPPTLNGNLRMGPLVVGSPAVGPDGTLYLAWSNQNDDSDAMFTRSTDGGASWSQPVSLATDTQGDQFMPWLATTRGGKLWAMWFDRRNDPANMLVDVYAAVSTDKGLTFTEYKVTDVASDPRVGLPLDRSNRGFYGDYQGLTADDQTGANILWNETRPGSQQVYFARVNPSQTRLSASAATGGVVTASGRAAFRGRTNPGFTETDANPDGPPGAAQAGIEMTGAKVFQVDPYVPVLTFEWHTAGLFPGRGQIPDNTRFLWNFRIGTGATAKQYQLQGKLANIVTPGTLADDPQGHVTHTGAAFQLRGNCLVNWPVAQSPVANCPHVAWLTGSYDTTRSVVRVQLPIGAAYAPAIASGATLLPNDVAGARISGAYQVGGTTNATISDLVDWPDEDAYGVPTREAFIGIAPAGTPSGAVTFQPLTLDAAGDFSTNLAGGAGSAVYLKTCFDGRCDVTTAAA